MFGFCFLEVWVRFGRENAIVVLTDQNMCFFCCRLWCCFLDSLIWEERVDSLKDTHTLGTIILFNVLYRRAEMASGYSW